MSLFFAFSIPEPTHTKVLKLSKALQQLPDYRSITWTKAENLHITLCFLGSVANTLLAPLVQQVTAALREQAVIELELGEPHLFPSARRPKVIALQVTVTPTLLAVAQAIERTTSSLGFPVEPRPFRPHLTLGYVPRWQVQCPAPPNSQETIAFTARQVVLFHSNKQRDDKIYQPLASIPLLPPLRE